MTNSTTQTFSLPDVGEGLTEADIVAWHVAIGDTVAVNQRIVEIETAKSVVELPSPYAGEVVELFVAAGDTVAVGSPILSIRTTPASSEPDLPTPDAADTAEIEPKLLVGYGVKNSRSLRRRRGAVATTPTAATTVESAVGAQDSVAQAKHAKPRAKPPVRKLAKVVGVDLDSVAPSGPDGIIVRADVLQAAGNSDDLDDVTLTSTGVAPARGIESRIPIKGIRKHTAAAMVASAFTAPHVTEFITVDVTRTLELRDIVQQRREFRDVKLTPLAFVARAYLRALTRTPMATARWDEAAQEIVVPAGVNLGIAATTPRGLMVPNIKDAHAMGLVDLATAINGLAAAARAGKTTPEAMSDGTTTITNVGVFGVDAGTPILNPGETAILAVGAIRRQPWVVEDKAGERIEPRSILQLAVSFDHRVIDGQEGSQLLADTAALLAEPGLAVL